ncbi:adenosine deaminase family protein [Fodinicurvata sediminis]|uniref:adenosine deaminase family protein n=1 Tax=Fodinicurvata sediminis TaxID=1121832 RepID=UPI0003B471D1|nr:adenosine deaminase [Fodinicurvata sediminis]
MTKRLFSKELLSRQLTLLLAGAALSLTAACASLSESEPMHETEDAALTARVFEQLREHPVDLRMFLQAMPKGGDLHNHLSGAVYAESYVDWALEDGLCIIVERAQLAEPPCSAEQPRLQTALAEGQITRDQLINAWSLRNFVAAPAGSDSPLAEVSGHDQFFATFFRFDAATNARKADMLAEVAARNARQNIGYLELMQSFRAGEARTLAQDLDLKDASRESERRLRKAGIQQLAEKSIADLDAMEREAGASLGCQLGDEGDCPVTLRYVAQVLRTVPPAEVLAQSMVAFEMARQDPRVVAVNLVAPEDNDLVLKTYDQQMQIIGRLAEQYPDVGVTLHSGELTLGLVPPRDLSDHIRQAIETARATRIGHGIDIAYENNPERLLRQMANEEITVEVNLSSNAEILGVEGRDHPFQTYRRYGVPVVLSTDDEGVSRNDLTHEYMRAVETYDLDYSDLKQFARRALESAFLPGESLWQDFDEQLRVSSCASMSDSCRAFLDANERARRQWALEESFKEFEAERAELLRKGIMPPLSAYAED